MNCLISWDRWSFVGDNSSQKQEKIQVTTYQQPTKQTPLVSPTNHGLPDTSEPRRRKFWSHFGQQKYVKIHTVLSSPLRPGCSMFDIHWYSKIQQKRPKRPFVMFWYILVFFLCVCVLWWFAASSNTSAVEVLPNRSRLSIKSLTGTWRGMRHGQQLVIGLEGARMSRLATKRHSITRWSPLLQIKHCIKSRCHLSCHVIHVMNICIQLLSPKTSFKKPKLRQLKITVHSVQRCFIRVLHSGTYL